jgi:hypothetical protein
MDDIKNYFSPEERKFSFNKQTLPHKNKNIYDKVEKTIYKWPIQYITLRLEWD